MSPPRTSLNDLLWYAGVTATAPRLRVAPEGRRRTLLMALSEPALPCRRKPIIGVMGSGKSVYDDLAMPLGALLGSLPVNLLTGGGRGVMEAVSRHYTQVEDRQGVCIGVLPGVPDGESCPPPSGYPNPYVEVPIFTHLPVSGTEGTSVNSRNHINILSSDVIVALPGSHGTASEVQLAVRYKKPIILFLGESGAIDGLDEGSWRVARNIDDVRVFLYTALPQLQG